ncbi:MAG: phosphoribosylformylglycinamidine synthase subunit PurS [Candidatus Gastranaerophilales bacterium]|nr:phosphoribosylformylglycinamidine synthase subunit PurS [Candidatus Gastranaerophilales bacterium]
MKFRANIITYLKDEVKDPQGEAVSMVLKNLDLADNSSIRVGKYFVLELDAENIDEFSEKIEKIGGEILSNPLIENFEIQKVEEV